MRTTDVPADNFHTNGRSAIEILTKAALTVAVALLTARNLSKLRQRPRKLAIYESLTTLIVPTYALAEIAMLAVRTVQTYQQKKPVLSLRYHLSIALDQRAVAFPDGKTGSDATKEQGIASTQLQPTVANSAEESIPLSVVSPATPVSASRPLEIHSYLRLSALALLYVYSLANSLSYIRRVSNNARTFLDDFTFLLSLSIQINALVSIALTVHNTTWYVPHEYVRKFKSLRSERDASDLFISLAGWTREPELHLALALAISFQSISLLVMRQGGTGLEDGAVACENPFLTWYALHAWWHHRIWTMATAPSSIDVEDPVPVSVPCHGHNASDWDFHFKAITDVAFGLAFVGAWVPLLLVLRRAFGMAFSLLRMRRAGKILMIVDAFSFILRMGPWYVVIGLGMGVVTAWNLVGGDAGARWRWRDPWMGRFWTL